MLQANEQKAGVGTRHEGTQVRKSAVRGDQESFLGLRKRHHIEIRMAGQIFRIDVLDVMTERAQRRYQSRR